jgi:two-component system sensor histidine kinase BaeS
MVAMVGLVAVVLVIAGAGSLLLTRNAARQQATSQLVTEAQSLTTGTSHTQSIEALRVIKRVLRLEDARFIRVSAQGVVATVLPPGISTADVDPQRLLTGVTVSGRDGNLVFAIAPVPLSTRVQLRLRVGGAVAVVLTREVGDLGPSWSYFLLAGGAALLLAAIVAWQFSRRMSQPLIEAVEATGRIASGDLNGRIPVRANDYAEFTSLAESINAMAARLSEGRARERDLLLSVSHDLRTPLTSIRGFAEAITDGAVEDHTHAAHIIVAESRRLERLVGDLLDLTKLEARQLSVHIRPTDVIEVVTTTAEGFRPVAERNGVQLVVRLPEGPIGPASADPDRLAQILANLLENAFTFTRSLVLVSVMEANPAGDLTIAVDDDGSGIAKEDMQRVFERFYRVDRGPNRTLGSGLGLAIVAELAAAMGAQVHAESPVASASGGSRFVVSLLPWVAAPETA